MSCLQNDKIKDQAWLKLLDLYERAWDDFTSTWGGSDKLLILLSKAANCDEEYIGITQLENLFDELWCWDMKCLCNDVLTCVVAYVDQKERLFAENGVK